MHTEILHFSWPRNVRMTFKNVAIESNVAKPWEADNILQILKIKINNFVFSNYLFKISVGRVGVQRPFVPKYVQDRAITWNK